MENGNNDPNRLEIARAIIPLLANGQRKNVDSLVPDLAKNLNCAHMLEQRANKKDSNESKLRYESRWAITGLKNAGFIESVEYTKTELIIAKEKTSSGRITDLVVLTELGNKALDPSFDWNPYKTTINSCKANGGDKSKSDNTSKESSSNVNLNVNMAYSDDEFLAEVHLSKKNLEEMLDLLEKKKNLILQGPPGVGKTFIAKRLAYRMMESTDEERMTIIQFHQNYGYEDFVLGLKPDKKGGFCYENGSFYSFCEKATADPSRKYLFIIDEINRGNISRIFGEVMMLIESSHRGEIVTLMYDHRSFSIPKNLYIIGTMNTADRSLAMIDYALRRRFAYYDLKPDFSHIKGKKQELDSLVEKVIELNKEITEDPTLGPGYAIGHSFFMEGLSPKQIVENRLLPLLEEYWFDRMDRVKHWEEILGH